jgi:hypothetical protein
LLEIIHGVVGKDFQRIDTCDSANGAVHGAGRKPENAIDCIVGTPLFEKIDRVAQCSIQFDADFQHPADSVRCGKSQHIEKLIPVLNVQLAGSIVVKDSR